MEIYLFVFKPAYFRVTLPFCESGPQYIKGISFLLTSVHVNPHRGGGESVLVF